MTMSRVAKVARPKAPPAASQLRLLSTNSGCCLFKSVWHCFPACNIQVGNPRNRSSRCLIIRVDTSPAGRHDLTRQHRNNSRLAIKSTKPRRRSSRRNYRASGDLQLVMMRRRLPQEETAVSASHPIRLTPLALILDLPLIP